MNALQTTQLEAEEQMVGLLRSLERRRAEGEPQVPRKKTATGRDDNISLEDGGTSMTTAQQAEAVSVWLPMSRHISSRREEVLDILDRSGRD